METVLPSISSTAEFNATVFDGCTTKNGGGGAVYIENSVNIVNNATFRDTNFTRCQALYGGAVLVSLKYNLVNLSFTRCNFEHNKALLTSLPSGQNGVLFGGNAVLAISHGIHVLDCKFIQNKRSKRAVKVYIWPKESTKAVQLSYNDDDYYYGNDSIHFSGCAFDQDVNSQSSISIVDQNKLKSRNRIEVSDCKFSGKLSKSSHYIEGFLLSKEKLQVSSCSFESGNKEPVSIDLIDENHQIGIEFNDDVIGKISNKAFMIAIIFLMCTSEK